MPSKAVFVGSYFDFRQIPSDKRPQIAFAGRSNVGKSTLLNSLVGVRKLARTSKTPGRTQSVNFFLIDDRYYFVDLPGYGFAQAPDKVRKNWGMLVDKYINNVENLCGMVFLLDSRRVPGEEDLMMVEWIESKRIEYALVLTKVDKLSRNELVNKKKEIEADFKRPPILFSDRNGLGRTELLKWIEGTVGR